MDLQDLETDIATVKEHIQATDETEARMGLFRLLETLKCWKLTLLAKGK